MLVVQLSEDYSCSPMCILTFNSQVINSVVLFFPCVTGAHCISMGSETLGAPCDFVTHPQCQQIPGWSRYIDTDVWHSCL